MKKLLFSENRSMIIGGVRLDSIYRIKRPEKSLISEGMTMAYNGFSPGREYQVFKDVHGEDTFITMNLLYIAFELSELYDDAIVDDFDELCEDVLELSLDEEFENYDIVSVADAVNYIIHDSNYTVHEYHRTYKRNPDKVHEELLALLNSDDEEV